MGNNSQSPHSVQVTFLKCDSDHGTRLCLILHSGTSSSGEIPSLSAHHTGSRGLSSRVPPALHPPPSSSPLHPTLAPRSTSCSSLNQEPQYLSLSHSLCTEYVLSSRFLANSKNPSSSTQQLTKTFPIPPVYVMMCSWVCIVSWETSSLVNRRYDN